QRQRSGRNAGRIFPVLLEGRRQHLTARDRYVDAGDDLLLEHPAEVVDVVQAGVLDVQGVAAEPRSVREQDPRSPGVRNVDEGPDGVGTVTDVDGLGLGYLGGAGVIDVAVPRWTEQRP